VTQQPGAVTTSRPPRVVLFRANAIDSDSRAKKFALSLARLGYEVHVLSAEDPGTVTPERRLGPVLVHPVMITHALRDVRKLTVGGRRRRQFRVIDWTPVDEYVTQVTELKQAARWARSRAEELRSPQRQADRRTALWWALWWARWLLGWLRFGLARARLLSRRIRWRAQWVVNVSYRQAWREWDRRKQRTALLASTRGMLPEVEDYAASFAKVLDGIAPDVVHVHHPLVLGTAVRAARRQRAEGRPCAVVYDAREDFLGIPVQEQGNWRRHSVLVREEARYIRAADAVVTVSEPIADTLLARYSLPTRPAVVLNVPIDGQHRDLGPTVRQVVGLQPWTPLVVYSGAVSRARGMDTLIQALAHLPGVHAVIVPVPFPHPHTGELLDQATGLGVADRLHLVPPVGQDRLLHYLSGADVGVMPLRTGSANIEQALPNKLFENLHAGLTMVTSDAALMKQFVTEHDLGEVYHDPDAADLAAAIGRALAHPRETDSPDWRQLCQRYSWQGQEPVIRRLYGGLVPAPDPDGIQETRFPSLTVTPDLPSVPAGRPAAMPMDADAVPAAGAAGDEAAGPLGRADSPVVEAW
jgi:glycosyltransferase involved in cell wall biosynthesis